MWEASFCVGERHTFADQEQPMDNSRGTGPTWTAQTTQPGQCQCRQDRINTGRTVPSQVDSTGLKSMHSIENNCFCSCLLKCVARPVHRRAPENSVSRRRNSSLRNTSENVLACSSMLSRSGVGASEGFKTHDEFGRRVAPVHV